MKLVLKSLVVWLLVGLMLRAFMLSDLANVAVLNTAWMLCVGVINDLQSFAIMAGLVGLFGFFGERSLRIGFFIACAITMVIVIAELFFWQEFESRLDRLVFHYLAYPKEVLVFLEDQFFVSIFVLPFLLVCWLLARVLGWSELPGQPYRYRWFWPTAALVVIVFGTPFGQSHSRLQSEIASNGYLGVVSAARYREYDVPWLAQAEVDPSGGFTAQPVAYTQSEMQTQMLAEVRHKKHVVLIIEESFAGPVWQNQALREQYLPNFAELRTQSVSFEHAYATGSRTTRGLEALLNGFPPLPGISTTERDGFERLPSLARGLSDGGFYPIFLYGGWPGFSNFSNYWRASGYREIFSRHDFDESFETSWGVSDGALFTRLIDQMTTLSEEHEQVFLTTLTVSHHRPYDFPEGEVEYTAAERRSEFAMAYADHALGEFFAAAREQPWYADTLFVVVADHAPRPRGDSVIPAQSYRIPLLFHGAGIQPHRMQNMVSSMSLATTLMDLFNIDTLEQFAGQNLFCDCDTPVPIEYGYHVGLLARDEMLVVRADGEAARYEHDLSSQKLHLFQTGDDIDVRPVLEMFAPAYQWFYDTGSLRRSPNMDHTKIALD